MSQAESHRQTEDVGVQEAEWGFWRGSALRPGPSPNTKTPGSACALTARAGPRLPGKDELGPSRTMDNYGPALGGLCGVESLWGGEGDSVRTEGYAHPMIPLSPKES